MERVTFAVFLFQSYSRNFPSGLLFPAVSIPWPLSKRTLILSFIIILGIYIVVVIMSGLAMMMSGVFRLLVIRCEYVGKRNIKMPFDLVHHDALQGFGNLVVILA